jgi:hypothetical protein
VKWFDETNNSMTPSLYLVGVPAPAYRKDLSEEANKLVLGAVLEFNDQLRQEAENLKHRYLVLYKAYKNAARFSNNRLSVDGTSLNLTAKAVYEPQIQPFSRL